MSAKAPAQSEGSSAASCSEARMRSKSARSLMTARSTVQVRWARPLSLPLACFPWLPKNPDAVARIVAGRPARPRRCPTMLSPLHAPAYPQYWGMFASAIGVVFAERRQICMNWPFPFLAGSEQGNSISHSHEVLTHEELLCFGYLLLITSIPSGSSTAIVLLTTYSTFTAIHCSSRMPRPCSKTSGRKWMRSCGKEDQSHEDIVGRRCRV